MIRDVHPFCKLRGIVAPVVVDVLANGVTDAVPVTLGFEGNTSFFMHSLVAHAHWGHRGQFHHFGHGPNTHMRHTSFVIAFDIHAKLLCRVRLLDVNVKLCAMRHVVKLLTSETFCARMCATNAQSLLRMISCRLRAHIFPAFVAQDVSHAGCRLVSVHVSRQEARLTASAQQHRIC